MFLHVVVLKVPPSGNARTQNLEGYLRTCDLIEVKEVISMRGHGLKILKSKQLVIGYFRLEVRQAR